MNHTNILRKLILKFLKGTINPQESRELDELLRDEQNANLFKEAIKDDYLLTTWEKKVNTENSLANSLDKIETNSKPRPFRMPPIYRYAAAAVVLYGLATFWYSYTSKENTLLVPSSTNKIELILANGESHLLDETQKDSIKEEGKTAIGYINQGKLSYKQNDTEEIAFNTLHVPYGKQFELELSDGTFVHLNAGSTLKYPVGFTKQGSRTVVLEGEAYFQVTHDSARKFIVKTNEIDVTVLGTEFNVSAYKEDIDIKTTLVYGSVQVTNISKNRDGLVLVPQEQSVWQKTEQTLTKQIVDTHLYTGWRKNELLFNKASFNDIAKKLERSYDIKITGYDAVLGEEKFTAKFKNETIAQIIDYFSDASGFEYTVNGNNINIISK